jgi:putative alpha-1,2-mannosidase
MLNGKSVSDSKILQSEVLGGGILELEMGNEPNLNWGIAK